MERLPIELRQEILQCLRLQDIKSIRLTSTSWAKLAQPFLIRPTFLSLPHRDDFSRLLLLSQHPSFARSIEKLELDMGELNEYHARHNTFFVQYMRDPEDRDQESQGAWAEYAKLKNQKELLVDKYCNPELLEETFKTLPNLRAIDFNLTRCPFEHPLLQQIWKIPTTRLLSRVSITQRFSNVIYAARHLALDSLSHDCLPFEVWGQRSILEDVPATFQALRSLKVSLDYSVFPNALHSGNSFTGFNSALCAAPNLQVLHIGFANSIRPDWNFTQYMGNSTWRNLHTLGLEAMNLAEEDVAIFLIRHAASLKQLQLGVYEKTNAFGRVSNMQNIIQFRHGSLMGLLTRIRERMRLKKLNMRGDMFEGETVSLTPYSYGVGLYDDEWVRVPDAVQTAAPALAAERFVLGETEWDDAKIGFMTVNSIMAEVVMRHIIE
jgi:hypothetical protein